MLLGASKASFDERLAPNSYNARVQGFLFNVDLREYAWSFDSLHPTLVVKGPGSAEMSVKKME